jgi:hypothetical protein
MSNCGSYLEATEKVQLCFLFPLKHENVAGRPACMLPQFVRFPLLPFLLLLLHNSKFCLLFVISCCLFFTVDVDLKGNFLLEYESNVIDRFR